MAKAKSTYILCIDDRDCGDLEKGKVYPKISDPKAKRDGFIRVIDESGEDYLYPESYFVPVEIPAEARQTLDA
jgi:hypothetical protein